MNSTELKALVKEYFNLVEADVTEVVNEEFAAEETNLEITEETFGEIADINKAFTIKYPGSSLQIGDKVTVVTAEGQEMDAPDGTHELEDGTKIVTKDSVVEKIESADGEKVLAAEEVEEVEIEMEEIIVEVEDETSLEEQMKSMEVKMAKMEEKMNSFMEAPAAEATVTSTGKDVKTGFSKFDVSSAANSKDMELALNLIKNKK